MPDLVNSVLARNYGAETWEEAKTSSADAVWLATEVTAPVAGSCGHFGGPWRPRTAGAVVALAGFPVVHPNLKYREQEEGGQVNLIGRGDHRCRSVPPASFEPFLLQGIAS
jgi:hypothetical protein